MIFSFGRKEHEIISVDVLRYENQTFDNCYDGNWLNCQISVKAGGFHGSFRANLFTKELVDFLTQLQTLYKTLCGSAELKTLEEQIYLKINGDGKGHMNLEGRLTDGDGHGNKLLFSLEFDQTLLEASIQELQNVTESFPVR